MTKNHPIRTCLVTKEKRPQSELLRFTVQQGVLVWDQGKKSPGRGGYVVAKPEAIKKLPKFAGKISHFLRGRCEISDTCIQAGMKQAQDHSATAGSRERL